MLQSVGKPSSVQRDTTTEGSESCLFLLFIYLFIYLFLNFLIIFLLLFNYSCMPFPFKEVKTEVQRGWWESRRESVHLSWTYAPSL